MLSILLEVQNWQQYLLGRRFTIRTDQWSLVFLLDQRFRYESQHLWLLTLAGFDYAVKYKKVVENKVADALSRRNESEMVEPEDFLSCTISTVEPSWLGEVPKMIDQSPYLKELQERDTKGSLPYNHYKKLNWIWFYKERVLIDHTSELCKVIFHDHLSSLGGGHSGNQRTLCRIKLSFWWPGMKVSFNKLSRSVMFANGTKKNPSLSRVCSAHYPFQRRFGNQSL